MNPHTKNQILAHLAEAHRLLLGLPASDTTLAIADAVDDARADCK